MEIICDRCEKELKEGEEHYDKINDACYCEDCCNHLEAQGELQKE